MHSSQCRGEAGSRAAQEGSARRALQAGLAAAAPGGPRPASGHAELNHHLMEGDWLVAGLTQS